MRDELLDAIDPAEARMTERIHDWLDQAVMPVDAAAIARSAAASRPQRGWLSRTGAFATRLAAGVAVLAIGLGGVVFVAGRSPSTIPGAPASPSASPALPGFVTPVEVTGRFQVTDCDDSAMDVNGGTQARGKVCPIVMLAASDPRLAGSGEVRVDRDLHEGGFALAMTAYRIENAGGAWQGLPGLAIEGPELGTSTRTITLRGEGGYAGSTVVVELSQGERVWELRGYIIEGEPPTAIASEPPME